MSNNTIKVLFTGTVNPVTYDVPASVTTWGDLVKEVGSRISFNNVTATDMLAKTVYGHADSKLNVVNESVKIFLSPVEGFKGGADYAELKATVKAFRVEAVQNDDEEILNIIGNYTQDKADVLQTKIDLVNAVLTSRANGNTGNGNVVDSAALASLEARVTQVELVLGLLNGENIDAFKAYAKEFGDSLKKG